MISTDKQSETFKNILDAYKRKKYNTNNGVNYYPNSTTTTTSKKRSIYIDNNNDNFENKKAYILIDVTPNVVYNNMIPEVSELKV